MDRCPVCGCSTSLAELQAEYNDLQAKELDASSVAKKVIWRNGRFELAPDPNLNLDLVICADCGLTRYAGARKEAEDLRRRILELKGPVKALATLNDPPNARCHTPGENSKPV